MLTNSGVPTLLIVLALIISLCLYPIPLIVAVVRKHPNKVAIGVLNLLLGWTFLGWVGALVWALTRQTNVPQYVWVPSSTPASHEGLHAPLSTLDQQILQDQASGSPRWIPVMVITTVMIILSAGVAAYWFITRTPSGKNILGTTTSVPTGSLSQSKSSGDATNPAETLEQKPFSSNVIGAAPNGSTEILGRLKGKFEQLCKADGSDNLNWPSREYDVVMFTCDEPKEKGTATYFDDFPKHIFALRRHSGSHEPLIALDSSSYDYDVVLKGTIKGYDTVFAQTSTGGSGGDDVTTMVTWDENANSPRLIDVDKITSHTNAVPDGWSMASDFFPRWDRGSKIQFSTELLRPGESKFDATGGNLTLFYSTKDGGLTWQLDRKAITPQ